MTFTMYENKIIYTQDEKLLAEISFPACGEDTKIVDINHTFADPSLRGQGTAGVMMQQVADSLRQTERKAVLSCSYAQKWFEKHPEYSDLIAD